MAVPPALAARLAETILSDLTRTYPYRLNVTLHAASDLRLPAEATPIFCGSFDWHSSVHSHRALVRLRAHVSTALRARIDETLRARLTPAAAAAELAFLEGQPAFELPYGIAWLLALAAELRAAGPAWHTPVIALESLARERLLAWARRLPAPVRSGEHAQSAFAIGLGLDWAAAAGDSAAHAELAAIALGHHGSDRDLPLHLEPGGHDFLSPTLSAAALMARVCTPERLAAWLDVAAPRLGREPTLEPVSAVDRADGKLVHWDGLDLSRAWMLAAIAGALPSGDVRADALGRLAARHGALGVAALDDMTFAGSHWLPSFAVHWLTE
jgi:hypothetical protein